MRLFPLNTGVSEVRGIVELIQENRNRISMSKLAQETNTDIAGLFPIVDAGVMLGLCRISKGSVLLTDNGAALSPKNSREMFSKGLAKAEPFRSAIALLSSKDGLKTKEIGEALKRKGITFHSDAVVNCGLLRDLLLKWGTTNRLFGYDPVKDRWYRYA